MVEPSNGFVSAQIDTTSEWRKFPKWMLDEKAIEKFNVEVRNGNEVQLKHLISTGARSNLNTVILVSS